MGACFCGQWSRSFARLLFKSRFRSAFGTNRREACGCPVFQILENVAPEAKLLLQHEFISRQGLFQGSCFWEDSGTGGPCSGATCFFLLARSLRTSLPAPQMNSPFLTSSAHIAQKKKKQQHAARELWSRFGETRELRAKDGRRIEALLPSLVGRRHER